MYRIWMYEISQNLPFQVFEGVNPDRNLVEADKVIIQNGLVFWAGQWNSDFTKFCNLITDSTERTTCLGHNPQKYKVVALIVSKKGLR